MVAISFRAAAFCASALQNGSRVRPLHD